MSGIRYGVGNLDLWEQFRVAVGFGAGGITILACMECGDQVTFGPIVEREHQVAARGLLMGMLQHIEACPPRKKPTPPEGPIAMEILNKGLYKFLTAPLETNNDSEQDCA